jgi:ACR3 family arsenite efflux pump ArsB
VATSSIAGIGGIGDVERRELVATGLRAGLSTGVLLLAYFLLPVDLRHRSASLVRDLGVMARLGVAIAIFVAVLVFEIRGITRAKHPMLRAGVAMAVVIPLFLIFFAWIYLNMSGSDPATFHGAMSRMTALYFTVTVFSTVGFGDITPHTDLARMVVTFQMIADLVVIAIVVRLILGVANRTVGARSAVGTDGAGSTAATDAAT